MLSPLTSFATTFTIELLTEDADKLMTAALEAVEFELSPIRIITMDISTEK